MEHLNVILDALGAEINRINDIVSNRDWQLREANDRLEASQKRESDLFWEKTQLFDKSQKELQDVRGYLSAQSEERAKDHVIMAQAAKLVVRLRDSIKILGAPTYPEIKDALDNILAVLADVAKEES